MVEEKTREKQLKAVELKDRSSNEKKILKKEPR